MKRTAKLALVCTLIGALICPLFSPAFAEAMGKLNVFTDIKGTEIFVDGKLAGEEQVVGYSLPVGEHYVQVKYQGKTSYAKMVSISEGRTSTITSDNFVDIRTSTPSRGAVDTEAARLREYRGNAGFGYFGTSPMSGLSVKWWALGNIGIQGIAFTSTYSDYYDTSCAGRLLVGFPQKIFAEEVMDAYMALGYGRSWHSDKGNSANNIYGETTSISFGIEVKLGQLANALLLNNKRYIISDSEEFAVFLVQLATLGLLNVCYTSVELGLEQKHIYKGTTVDSISNMMINYGFHYYF
jgi:hypothetical protein